MINSSKLLKNTFYVFLIILAGFFVSGLIMVLRNSEIGENNNKLFTDYYLKEQREMVKNEVLSRIDEINYELENAFSEADTLILQKIQQMTYLLESNTALSKSNLTLTVSALKELTQLDSTSPYFILNTSGQQLYSNLDSFPFNKYTYQFTEVLSESQGLFYDVPFQNDTLQLYYNYIPNLDVIIGTGYNQSTEIEKVKTEIIHRLQYYYENEEHYIFITDYDGISLVAGNPEYVGKAYSQFTAEDGRPLHELFLEIITDSGEGYVDYGFPSESSDELLAKTSYIADIEAWSAYIGMGFYTHELAQEISESTAAINTLNNQLMQTIACVMIITSMLGFFAIRRVIRLQIKYISQEEGNFNQLLQLSDEAIVILSNDGSIIYQNHEAIQLFGSHLEKYIDGYELTFSIVSDNTFSYDKSATETLYLHYKTEPMVYQGQVCHIYYMNDVTTSYVRSTRFEKLALIDELTGMPNRRCLQNDFLKMDEDPNTRIPSSIAMIDLDFFKSINDTYGHNIGDEVIIALADVFKENLGPSDTFYRYGGEEFVILLKSISVEASKQDLIRIKNLFSQQVKEKLDFDCTFSGGVTAIVWEDNPTLHNLLAQADMLLYQAKSSGRNCIH